jgi:hypothetical protein
MLKKGQDHLDGHNLYIIRYSLTQGIRIWFRGVDFNNFQDIQQISLFGGGD